MCYCIFLMYCIISNSSAHVATAVLPECFEMLLGECTHYTNLRLKKKNKLSILKKYGILQQFHSESKNALLNIYYQDY